METEKIKFYNLPDENITTEDYKAAIESVLESAERNNTVKAIYLMGGEPQPGFSDLDFVVAYKDNIKPELLPYPPSIDAKSKFIFTHRYLSFFESDFKNFYYIYPKDTANLRLIYGENINLNIPENILEAEDYKMLLAFILFDFLVNKLLPFKQYKSADKLDIRRIIAELHSLIYTFRTMEKITGEKLGGEFSLAIKDLRKTWFENNIEKNIRQVLGLLEEGINFVSGVEESLDKFLRDKNLEAEKELSFKNKNVNIDLPESFSYFFLAYISSNGPFGQKIKSCLNKTKLIILNLEGVKTHVLLMDSLFKSTLDYGFKMPFSYGISKNENILKKFISYINIKR